MTVRPLAGVRILSIEQYGAGPYGTMLLAELGADVIKLEAPALGGDMARAVGPYFLGDNDSEFFQTFSRSKRSLAVDIKEPAGRAAFEALAREADAVANNLRGDQPAKLRLTFAELRELNPRLVCAHLSAYGRGNARERWPGYDYLMQAEAGFMALTGEPDSPPTRFGLSMVDYMAGALMATGLLAALLNARTTGQGCDVDVSLFDTALHQLSYPATWYLNEGDETERLPRSAHPVIAPSQLYKAADGWVLLMCQKPRFWDVFCRRVGRPDWLAEPAFATVAARRQNIAQLQRALDAHFMAKPVAHWIDLLSGEVPIAPIYGLAQALDNPFVEEVGMIDRVAHEARPEGLRMLVSPIQINGARMPGRRAPKLGEHSGEILDALAAQRRS